MSKTPAFSARDIRLMIGFGLFVEVVLGYMLLIDAPLGQLQKLREQLSKSETAYATLKEAVRDQQGSSRRKLPPVLELKAGESCSLAIQGYVDRLTARHGVTPLGTTILKQEATTCNVQVEAQGSYEALGGLISELEAPAILLGMDGMELKTDPQDPDRILARLTLTLFYRENK